MFKQSLKNMVRLVQEQEAVTTTEYAVMLSLIVLVALGAITGLGQRMVAIFQYDYFKLDGVGR